MDKIVWLLNEKIVGEADLKECTTGEERRQLAFEESIKAYDNFKFISPDGTERINGADVKYQDKNLGVICGETYEKMYGHHFK